MDETDRLTDRHLSEQMLTHGEIPMMLAHRFAVETREDPLQNLQTLMTHDRSLEAETMIPLIHPRTATGLGTDPFEITVNSSLCAALEPRNSHGTLQVMSPIQEANRLSQEQHRLLLLVKRKSPRNTKPQMEAALRQLKKNEICVEGRPNAIFGVLDENGAETN